MGESDGGLLPRHAKDFGDRDYWDAFFRRRGRKAFEWYGEYAQLCSLLRKYARPSDKLLVVGCGNSALSQEMHDVGGYRELVSIDLSEVAIRQMKSKRPDLDFRVVDATDMTAEFADGAFSCVLDKGTLDAMFTGEEENVVKTVDKMFEEICRVLRLGGRFLCISLLQPHILAHLVNFFVAKGWPVRVVRVKEVEDAQEEAKAFPVFAVIATKFKQTPNAPQILELCTSTSAQTRRLSSQHDLLDSVRGLQQFAVARANKKAENDVALQLRPSNCEEPKYSLFVTDRDKPSKIKFAIFIVPQGRDGEWLFSSPAGRQQLAASADCRRLVVVHLHRAYVFENLESVQAELSASVMELAPSDVDQQVPFLSVGGGELGARSEKCRGKSQFSGEFVVEDVDVDGQIFRRLVFLSNTALVQSEAKISTVKVKKKTKRIIDASYLACQHHALMIASLGLFSRESGIKVLLIGLGGGALAMYMANNFARVRVDVVEIDPAIAKVAKDQFGFNESDRLKVFIDDGLEFIANLDGKKDKYDIVMFDVDSKDTTMGISCPPPKFLEIDFLSCLKSNCLVNEGLFVLNLVCRDPAIRRRTLEDIKKLFGSVLSYQIPEEVNEILYCSPMTSFGTLQMSNSHPFIEAFKKTNDQQETNRELIDIAECLKRLKIIS